MNAQRNEMSHTRFALLLALSWTVLAAPAFAAPTLMGTTGIPYTDQLIVKLKSQQNVATVPPEVTSRLSGNAGAALAFYRPMSGQSHVFKLLQFTSVAEVKALGDRLKATDPDVEVA